MAAIVLSVFACCVALGGLAAVLVFLRRNGAEWAAVRDTLLSLSRRDLDVLTMPPASHIPERPLMGPEAALAYYRNLAGSPLWAPLAHRFQVDTRDRLVQARIQSEAGKPYAAMMHVGAAWYASQLAILCEREIDAALKRVQREAAEKQLDAQLDGKGDHRPARY